MAHVETREPDLKTKRDRELVPRVLLRAVGLLIAASLAITLFARLTDQPLAAMPPDIPIIEERSLVIVGSMSGAATVHDADTGALIADLDATQGGFVAGIWRTMRRERGKYGVDASAPIRLVRFQDGHIALRDDLTPWRAELIGFGADNTAVFMRLLKSKQNQG